MIGCVLGGLYRVVRFVENGMRQEIIFSSRALTPSQFGTAWQIKSLALISTQPSAGADGWFARYYPSQKVFPNDYLSYLART